jgi:hypothetical protein
MTKADLRAAVRRRLEAASSVFVSDDDIDDAVNDGYREISDATEWREVWRTVDLCASRPYYDVRTIFAGVEILTPLRAFQEDTNRWLAPRSPGDLDSTYLRWEQVGGQPDAMLMRGLFWLGYWPITASEAGTVKQYASALPDALDDDEDEPGFSDVYHEVLVDYALADLWPQFGEVSKALEAWANYEAGEGALLGYIQGRGSVSQVRGRVNAG